MKGIEKSNKTTNEQKMCSIKKGVRTTVKSNNEQKMCSKFEGVEEAANEEMELIWKEQKVFPTEHALMRSQQLYAFAHLVKIIVQAYPRWSELDYRDLEYRALIDFIVDFSIVDGEYAMDYGKFYNQLREDRNVTKKLYDKMFQQHKYNSLLERLPERIVKEFTKEWDIG